MNEKKRGSFTGSIGFILAAAGSAVGLGNLWRFPYLAAKDGGGLFVVVYILLAVTFGFALMTTEFAIGRKTGTTPLQAYGKLCKKFNFLGWIATLAPVLIFPYYCVIGGWVTKYAATYTFGGAGKLYATGSGEYFNGFISSTVSPVIWFLIFMVLSAVIVLMGVEKGIEKASKLIMPALLLLIIGIAVYSMTLSYTDPVSGETRTALDGLRVYLVPDFSSITVPRLISILMDAVGQLFYSLSIAMGILITYGSYCQKDSNLISSVNSIELFDSGVALIAGLVVVPSVFVFQGYAGLESSGPSLMFVSLPAVFEQMGFWGNIIGALFFILVLFAALTSSISLLEAIASSIIDRFHMSRLAATAIVVIGSVLVGIAVCFGYNIWYAEIPLPNGTAGQLLDLLDYVSNSLILPIVALLTCILIGWVTGTDVVTEELLIGLNGKPFRRKSLYKVMTKYVCPVLLVIILLQAFQVFSF